MTQWQHCQLQNPVIRSIVIVFLLAAAAGVVYGIIGGKFRGSRILPVDGRDRKTLIQYYSLRLVVCLPAPPTHRRADLRNLGWGSTQVSGTATAVTIFDHSFFVGMLQSSSHQPLQVGGAAPIFVPMR